MAGNNSLQNETQNINNIWTENPDNINTEYFSSQRHQ